MRNRAETELIENQVPVILNDVYIFKRGTEKMIAKSGSVIRAYSFVYFVKDDQEERLIFSLLFPAQLTFSLRIPIPCRQEIRGFSLEKRNGL